MFISKKKLFLLFLSIRTLMALLSGSWYVPDETWQSVEIAHGIVWGPDRAYKTWEWDHGLRSYLHPLIFVPGFEFLKLVRLDTPFLVALLPRLIQGFLSSIADVANTIFYQRYFAEGPSDIRWFVFIYSTNWCLLYHGSRTVVNQLELVITSLALTLYDAREGRGVLYVVLISISFITRATTAIFWLPLVLYQICIIWDNRKTDFVNTVFLQLVPTAVGTVAICVAIDCWFYGKFTFVTWNFLKFNLIMDVSSQYGVNSVHWYFSNALPTFFLGPLGLSPLLGGFLQSLGSAKNGPPKIFVFVLIWSILCYSALAHKEQRFILPLVPLCICYITCFVARFSRRKEKFGKCFIFVILATHLPLTAYLSCVHQTGTTQVVQHLAEKFRPENSGDVTSRAKILFLMPCHTTSYHSHFHLANADLRFLECPPSLSTGSEENLAEAAEFYANPIKYLDKNFESLSPTHVVCFNIMSDTLKEFLLEKQFEKCAEFFHTHIPEGRIGSHVHVHCKL